MNKIVITGANGNLSQELIKELPSNVKIHAFSSKQLDITDPKKITILEEIKPSIIFHFAAKTDVDWCESHKKESYAVNVLATKNLLKIAQRINAIFVFPSTYYVFTGLTKDTIDDRYDEPNIKNIIGVYSKHKLLAEQTIQNYNYSKSLIVRLGSLFGGGFGDKKFVGKILHLAKKEKKIRIVADRYIQPSYMKDSIKNILPLVNQEIYGTYNMVGHGLTNFYDYARTILSYAKIPTLQLIPISEKDFHEKAPRSSKLHIINGKLEDIEQDQMRDWKVALKEYITEYFINS